MTDSDQLIGALDARVRRRDGRRDFFKAALGAAAFTGAITLASKAGAQAAITDADILNFALNLEYLEAQFYSYAATGNGLDATLLTGATGAPGAVSGGRKVNFTDPVVSQYAQEIAKDEIAHVKFLRTALGASAVSQPAIDVSATPTSAFSNAARAAGLIGMGETFDPYSSDEYFLLGAFVFEDVGVTAYKGAAPLIANNTYLDAAAGILAAEAFHGGIIRSVLYSKGIQTPVLRQGADAISGARDSLDGTSDLDQGVSPMAGDMGTVSNIAPTDAQGRAFSRTPEQVLNIVYLTGMAATAGGFFPQGLNGNIRASTASS